MHLDLDDEFAPYPYPPDSPIDSGPLDVHPPRFVCPDSWNYPLQPRKRTRTPVEGRNWPQLGANKGDAPVAELDEDDSGDELIVTRASPSAFSRVEKGKGPQRVDPRDDGAMQLDDSPFDSRNGSVRSASESESIATSLGALTAPRRPHRKGKGRRKVKKVVAKSTSTRLGLRDVASPELGEGSRYPRRLPIPLAVDIPTTPQEDPEIIELCKQTHEEASSLPAGRHSSTHSLADSLPRSVYERAEVSQVSPASDRWSSLRQRIRQ